METEAISHRVNQAAYHHFWLGSLATNSAHIFAAPLRTDCIYHTLIMNYFYTAARNRSLEAVRHARKLSAIARANGGGNALPTCL